MGTDSFDRPFEVLGRYFFVFTIRERKVGPPLYGRRNPDTAALIGQDNPIEMLDAYDVRNGEFNLYIAYAGRDNFNLEAQAESFLYRAGQRGVHIDVDYLPNGHHDKATVLRMLPPALDWLGDRLRPYARNRSVVGAATVRERFWRRPLPTGASLY